MFETFTPAPPDAILGLTEAFKKDPNPKKVNLGVGIYKDAKGSTPVLDSVKRAEERILQNENTKNYLGIDGTAEYSAAVQELLFGANHEVMTSNRSVTAQAPGGTGALRIAADFIFCMFPKARVWLSDPTWPNHPSIFKAAGLETGVYPYFDAATNGIKFDEMGNPAGHSCWRRDPVARLLSQSYRCRSQSGPVAENCRDCHCAQTLAPGRFCLPGLW